MIILRKFLQSLSVLLLTLGTLQLQYNIASGGIIYADPSGRWAYTYDGVGAGNNLDGTWATGASGSQSYDGSTLGGTLTPGTVSTPGNAPGGAIASNDGSTTFLRLQDSGDPRNATPSFIDPYSNRRIKIVKNIGPTNGTSTGLGLGNTVLDSGVTLSFRARLSTAATGILDDQYPGTTAGSLNFTERAGQAIGPMPVGGDGTVTSSGGNGMFSIRQSGAGGKLISFSLALSTDDDYFDSTTANRKLLTQGGLVTNLKNGTATSADVDIGDISASASVNVVPIVDAALTDWHEFWITIKGDTTGGGTHKVSVYLDGSLTPAIFDVTAGNASSTSPIPSGTNSYNDVLALGDTNTGGIWAFDTDFISIKGGVFEPVAVPEPSPLVLSVFCLGGLGFMRTRRKRNHA